MFRGSFRGYFSQPLHDPECLKRDAAAPSLSRSPVVFDLPVRVYGLVFPAGIAAEEVVLTLAVRNAATRIKNEALVLNSAVPANLDWTWSVTSRKTLFRRYGFLHRLRHAVRPGVTGHFGKLVLRGHVTGPHIYHERHLVLPDDLLFRA